MFSTGLVLALVGMCLGQQQQLASGPQYPQQSAVSQTSFQIGSAAAQQTKLEDIERDSLTAAAYGQKTQPQPAGKSSPAATAAAAQQQVPPTPQAYQTVPPQQYYVQPYPAQQPQFYVQPYQAQPYQAAFDYAGVQYMFVNPSANQVYPQYYVPAVPQPSAVPQYVTKQSSPAAYKSQAQQEYKAQQQYTAAPAQAQQEYKQQQFSSAAASTPALQQQQQQQYVYSAPAFSYVQQPAVPAAGSLDFSYVTRHPAATTQYKASAPAVQPQQQYQYTAAPVPQQQVQYQQTQPQYYYTVPATSVGQVAAEQPEQLRQQSQQQQQQPRVQQSAKSVYSSGVKSTTPSPVKESFAYKFESSPVAQQQQPQQSGAAYSTLRFSA